MKIFRESINYYRKKYVSQNDPIEKTDLNGIFLWQVLTRNNDMHIEGCFQSDQRNIYSIAVNLKSRLAALRGWSCLNMKRSHLLTKEI